MNLSRRDMLKWCGATGLGLATGGASWDSVLAQSDRPPVGLALCIGLNFIDPAVYRTNGHLTGCVPDADDMAALLGSQQQGFRVRTLYDAPEVRNRRLTDDRVGSRKWVRHWIERAARGPSLDGVGGLQAGDIFVVTYSGHGSNGRRDTNGDEALGKPPTDGEDETWCLYDGEMIDDERADLWSKFRPGVRIVAISDCCFSGSTARLLQDMDRIIQDVEAIEQARDATRSVDRPVTNMRQRFENLKQLHESGGQVRDRNAESVPLPARQLPEWVNRHLNGDRDYMASIEKIQNQIPTARAAQLEVQAEVIAIGAASDEQTAADMGSNGLFTNRLLSAWQSGQFESYDSFYRAIASVMPSRQTPQIDRFGKPIPGFANSRPFKIA
jgi:hypothetical protein